MTQNSNNTPPPKQDAIAPQNQQNLNPPNTSNQQNLNCGLQPNYEQPLKIEDQDQGSSVQKQQNKQFSQEGLHEEAPRPTDPNDPKQSPGQIGEQIPEKTANQEQFIKEESKMQEVENNQKVDDELMRDIKEIQEIQVNVSQTPVREGPSLMPNGGLQTQKVISCNCKKTKCIKKYCDCFVNNRACNETCKCLGCQNTVQYLKNRNNASKGGSASVANVADENQDKSDSNKKSRNRDKGCNCKKSNCLKKYCECYNAGQGCTPSCRCEDCKNNGGIPEFNGKPGGDSSQINKMAQSEDLSQQKTLQMANSSSIKNDNILDSLQMTSLKVNSSQREEKKTERLGEEEVETRLAQIMKLVPQGQEQNVLDFLAYCLS